MWEGTGGVGEGGGRRVWAPQGLSTLRAGAARAWTPSSPPAAAQLGALGAQRGRGSAGRAGPAVVPRRGGRVCGTEVESRRVVMLGWRGARGQGVETDSNGARETEGYLG